MGGESQGEGRTQFCCTKGLATKRLVNSGLNLLGEKQILKKLLILLCSTSTHCVSESTRGGITDSVVLLYECLYKAQIEALIPTLRHVCGAVRLRGRGQWRGYILKPQEENGPFVISC